MVTQSYKRAGNGEEKACRELISKRHHPNHSERKRDYRSTRMNRSLIAFAAIIAAAMAAGPTTPYQTFDCTEEGDKMVDAENMCWYHECTLNSDGTGLESIPRRCALGSKVSYNFIRGNFNPCTYNFDDVIGYQCDREQPSFDGPPPCHPLSCDNGGTAMYEADKCWCNCPQTWLGQWDCSLPTQDVSNLPPASNICVNGEPKEDWCASDPCLNNGVCFSQCDTFWCDCPDHESHDYLGKRCEL